LGRISRWRLLEILSGPVGIWFESIGGAHNRSGRAAGISLLRRNAAFEPAHSLGALSAGFHERPSDATLISFTGLLALPGED
jgi:hypothetical protein